MASFFSGQDGRLLISGSPAAKVRSWSFTANQAVLETSSLSDTDRTLIPGMRSVTGSCSIYYYRDGTTTNVGTLLGAVITATTVDGEGQQGGGKKQTVGLELKVAGGGEGGSDSLIKFYAYITSVSMTSSVGEVLSADISFEVSGAVTGLTL